MAFSKEKNGNMPLQFTRMATGLLRHLVTLNGDPIELDQQFTFHQELFTIGKNSILLVHLVHMNSVSFSEARSQSI